MLRSWSRQAKAVVCSSNVPTVSQFSTRGSPMSTAGSLVGRRLANQGAATLGAYASTLDAGYLITETTGDGRASLTSITLTREGRAALDAYTNTLRELLGSL